MTERLEGALAQQSSLSGSPDAIQAEAMEIDMMSAEVRTMEDANIVNLPLGWRKVNRQNGWRHAPIGMHGRGQDQM